MTQCQCFKEQRFNYYHSPFYLSKQESHKKNPTFPPMFRVPRSSPQMFPIKKISGFPPTVDVLFPLISTVFPWVFPNFPWFSLDFHGFPMVFPWFSPGFPAGVEGQSLPAAGAGSGRPQSPARHAGELRSSTIVTYDLGVLYLCNIM